MSNKPEFIKGFRREQYEILINSASAIFEKFAIVDFDRWVIGELMTERFLDMESTKVRRGFDLLTVDQLDELYQDIVTSLRQTWGKL